MIVESKGGEKQTGIKKGCLFSHRHACLPRPLMWAKFNNEKSISPLRRPAWNLPSLFMTLNTHMCHLKNGIPAAVTSAFPLFRLSPPRSRVMTFIGWRKKISIKISEWIFLHVVTGGVGRWKAHLRAIFPWNNNDTDLSRVCSSSLYFRLHARSAI